MAQKEPIFFYHKKASRRNYAEERTLDDAEERRFDGRKAPARGVRWLLLVPTSYSPVISIAQHSMATVHYSRAARCPPFLKMVYSSGFEGFSRTGISFLTYPRNTILSGQDTREERGVNELTKNQAGRKTKVQPFNFRRTASQGGRAHQNPRVVVEDSKSVFLQKIVSRDAVKNINHLRSNSS